MWSVDEIRDRTAVSTAVYQKVGLGDKQFTALMEAGVDRVEVSIARNSFDYRDENEVDELVRAVERTGITVVSVHGPFDLPYRDSSPESEREVIEGSVLGVTFAERVGARHYVGHFGRDERWKRILETLLERTEEMSVVLTTENQTGQPLKPYDEFVAGIDHGRVGWTLDIGHARDTDGVNPFVKNAAADALVSDCGHILHTHLHDTFDLPTKSDHRPPMHRDGLIRWVGVFEGLHAIGYDGHFVFEDGRGEDPEDWVRHAATFPERFCELYQRNQGLEPRRP